MSSASIRGRTINLFRGEEVVISAMHLGELATALSNAQLSAPGPIMPSFNAKKWFLRTFTPWGNLLRPEIQSHTVPLTARDGYEPSNNVELRFNYRRSPLTGRVTLVDRFDEEEHGGFSSKRFKETIGKLGAYRRRVASSIMSSIAGHREPSVAARFWLEREPVLEGRYDVSDSDGIAPEYVPVPQEGLTAREEMAKLEAKRVRLTLGSELGQHA